VTIGPVVVESIAPLVHGAGGRIDCHLMVDDPMGQLPLIAAAGGDSASFHLETVDAPDPVVARARELGLGVGLAVNPETPVEAAAEAAEGVDLVLVMSVHPGYSGQAFLPESVERIERLRELLPAEVLIEVDGGIKPDNVADVRSAGAQLIVAASAIFYEDDIADAYRRLVQAAGG
jgi:ribulose-phosphate 3-epimerase